MPMKTTTIPYGKGYQNNTLELFQGQDMNATATQQFREKGLIPSTPANVVIVPGTPVSVDNNNNVAPVSATNLNPSGIAIQDSNYSVNNVNGDTAPVARNLDNVTYYDVTASSGAKIAVQIDPAIVNTTIFKGAAIYYNYTAGYYTTTATGNLLIPNARLETGSANKNGFQTGSGITLTNGSYNFSSNPMGILSL